MNYYAGKRFVVTGAAGGLGREFCRQLLAEGARVAALDLPGAGLDDLQREFGERGSRDFFCVPCNITDAAACETAFAQIARMFEKIDGVIQNAGITHRSLFRETDPTVLRRVLEVNFFGAVHVARASLPFLAKPADMIAMSSVAGFAPLATRSAYAASKHALQGFFATLRAEEPDLFVLIASPSFIDTGGRGVGAPAAERPGVGGQSIAGRPLTPEIAAEKILSALAKRKRRVFLTRLSFFAFLLQFFAPAFYERRMLAAMQKET